MESKQARPTKLRNGSWGAKVTGAVRQGDEITIVARSGKSWQARVSRVLWSGDGVAICATESRATGRRGGYGGGLAAPVAGYSRYCTDRPDCGCYDCAS